MVTKWNALSNDFALVSSLEGLVEGPAIGTDNAVARFDGTTGALLQNSGTTISDTDVLTTDELVLTTELAVDYGGTGQTTYTDGQLLIGNSTGNTLTKATLTAGAGISIANSGGSVTISASAVGPSWTVVTGTSQALAVNNNYIANNAGLITMTLPATATVGDTIKIVGKGAGKFRVAQNAGQKIEYGQQTTTTGITGRIDAEDAKDTIEIVCTETDVEFTMVNSIGNLTVV